MDIFVSSEDRKEVLQLPIIAPDFEGVKFPHNNQTFSTISAGDIKLIGMAGLKTILINSWFPMKEYSFAKSPLLGTEAKEFFVKWKRKRRPIRVIIVNNAGYEFHNELYAIEEFTFGYDRVGDMTYSLSLEQFVPKKVT
ncbi:hypothetical protein ABFY48_01820 [Lysinibacillus pakistanensis]|uniref:hypothetical protein n=1 Tax=Lysinibacillus pakistanensis TaxID=759811 RepID=UPI003D2B4FEF